MKVTIDEKKKIMVVEVPLQTPKQSKSRKTMVVATAQGDTGAAFKGNPVFLSLNAYYKK
jgi:hypothetical protein